MFIISSVSDKYLGEEKIFSQAFDVLLEIIYNPKTYKGLIPKKAVKEKLMQTQELLLSLKQNKNAHSYYQFMRTYTRNNTDHITFFPETKYLDQVSSESINKTYQKMINEDRLQIFIGGDFDFEEMDELIKSKINRLKLHESKAFAFKNHFNSASEVNQVIDKTSTGQTRIFIGYDLGFTHTQKNATIMSLFNELFGAFENSKLFSNIREKLNLSYYVYSHYSPGNDLFFVNLETNKENSEKAIQEVDKQLKDCQNGLIDDDLFNQAKKNLINRLETSVDSQYKLLIYNVIDFIRYNEPFDLEKRKKAIENIKKPDLIDLIKTIKIDTTYIYTSGE
jgi:predicted Zn-dependent peptidase